MAAQSGSAILLEYGPQGSRQVGSGVLLQYGVVVTPRVMLTAGTVARWAASKVAEVTTTLLDPATALLDDDRAAPWQVGPAVQPERRAPWVIGGKADRGEHAPWVPRERRIDDPSLLPWGRARVADDEAAAPWGRYEQRIDPVEHAPWVGAVARDDALRMPWGKPRGLDPLPVHNTFPRVRSADLPQWIPWTRYSRQLNPGWGIAIPPGPQPNDDGTWVVPIKQVYIMINESTLTRVADGQVVPCFDLSLQLDVDAWTWSFSATVPGASLGLVGRETELQAAVNGEVVRLVVTSIGRDRGFPTSRLKISGKGRSAQLAAPYSPTLVFGNPSASRTAQQLAYDALLDNGVPLPWSIDWQLDDWAVPAGAWSLQGSRMDALVAIAAAAGGYVQPHNADQVLRILHRYPVAPWAWAGVTPDYELPSAPVTRESIEWVSKPLYNRVFVSGQGAGVLGQITREGTAGDLVAPMVTDALATATAGVRQRGRAILSDVGDQARVALRCPVFEETGLMVPGKFVRYVDGAETRIGIVRSVQVAVARNEAWQTVEVETHE